jgi:hypothetical protein
VPSSPPACGLDSAHAQEYPDLIVESDRAETRRFAESQVVVVRRAFFPRHDP